MDFFSNPAHILTFLLVCLLNFLTTGCGTRGASVIPDAPPPYPTFPMPQERYQNTGIYGGQSFPHTTNYAATPNLPIVPQQPDQESGSSYSYKPPVSQSPFPSNSSSSQTRHHKPSAEGPRFTLVAKGELWALAQDEQGNEIEWLKMKAGDRASLFHPDAMILTCSSGDLLDIEDANGKPIPFAPTENGISIIRLPAN